LEVGNETVSNREEYVRQTVKGTVGIGFAAADETLAEAGKVIDRVGDFFMKYIKELLLLSGGAVTLYAIYALITLKMMTARSAKVPTTTQITNTIPTTMPVTSNQQQIVTLFNNNVGLVTSADVTGNGKLVGILQTYFADANSAVALINLQKYFDNLPFDKKVIIYIESPDNNFRCGRYRGLDTRNNKVIIGLENGTNVFKNYDDIIDPISNDYNSNLYDVLEKCIQTINRPPNVVTPSPLIANETDGISLLSNAASTIPSLPLNAPSGGKKKTVKRRPKKNNNKTIQKRKNVKKRATKKNNKTNKKKRTTKH
jgi:hypothetical protein